MRNPFRRSYTIEEMNSFRFLQRQSLFADLDHDELHHFLPYLYLREYKANEVVYFRDDPSQALYLVKSGEVRLYIDIGDKSEDLTTCCEAEVFGENALLAGSRRTANAVTHSNLCELYVIPQPNILRIFEAHVEIKAKMYAALAYIYEAHTVNLFRAYRSSFGFFDLSSAFPEQEL